MIVLNNPVGLKYDEIKFQAYKDKSLNIFIYHYLI